MPPLWLLVDLADMAAVTAGLFFAGSLVVAAFVAEFVNHRSNAETSVPEGTPAPSGTGLWVVESTCEDTPARPRRDGQHLAVVAGPSATQTP
jgi:hypothetical protein